jgi:hypothetical protein
MPYIPDFDIEQTLGILNSVMEKFPEGSRERDAIELAQIALLYPRHVRKEDDFRRYYGEFFDPSFKVKIAHAFATRDEADVWLASGKAEEALLITIAGKGFQVVRLPGRLKLLDCPLPEELNERASKKDSE